MKTHALLRSRYVVKRAPKIATDQESASLLCAVHPCWRQHSNDISMTQHSGMQDPAGLSAQSSWQHSMYSSSSMELASGCSDDEDRTPHSDPCSTGHESDAELCVPDLVWLTRWQAELKSSIQIPFSLKRPGQPDEVRLSQALGQRLVC